MLIETTTLVHIILFCVAILFLFSVIGAFFICVVGLVQVIVGLKSKWSKD